MTAHRHADLAQFQFEAVYPAILAIFESGSSISIHRVIC